MSDILFVLFSSVAVLAALLAITRKNAVASACWLVLMFFGLAGVFVLLEAYFVAAVQILVYAGAIMVLFLFVIMLLDLKDEDLAARTGPRMKVLGVVLAGAFLATTLQALRDARQSDRVADRVAVVVRRAAPAPGPDPTAGAPAAPAPETLALDPAAPDVAPAREPGGTPGRPGPGDRAWTGGFRVGPSPEEAIRRVKVTVTGDGDTIVSLDGEVLALPAWRTESEGALSLATFPLAGAPEGSAIDVAVRRGGLDPAPGGGPDGSPFAIGRGLFERWLLPFEVVSLLLTGAIFGAVVLTKRRLA